MKPQAVLKRLLRALVYAALVPAWTSASAIQLPGPLVDTGWLADHRGEVVVLDVREDAASYLGQPLAPGKKPSLKKLTGHIPGAVSVPWKGVVAKGSEEGVALKAMLPSPEAFAALMQKSGVGHDSAIVIAGLGTKAKDQAHATRLYFTLKYFAHDKVALLDGGTAQWAKEGRPLAFTPESPPKGDFAVSEIRDDLLADTHDMEEALASGKVQLVDCRTEDYYLGLTYKRGFVSPGHKGHLPDAKSLPFVLVSDNAGPAKVFPERDLRTVAALKGVDLGVPTIVYCDTGVTASVGWFALHEILGNQETRLYDGSMHAWSAVDAKHPVVPLAGPAEQGVPAEAGLLGAQETVQALLVRPPRSLQTLVDERRDALRRHRDARLDALSGRRIFQPAWMSRREEMMDAYHDSLRAAHREHRDTLRFYRDVVRDAYAPWSRTRRDRAEVRSFVTQMEHLDRQERLDGMRFSRLYAPW